MKALTCIPAPSLPSLCPFLRQSGSLVLCGKGERAYMQDRGQWPKAASPQAERTPSQRQTALQKHKRKEKPVRWVDIPPSTLLPHWLEATALPSHILHTHILHTPGPHVCKPTLILSPEQVPPTAWNPIYSPHRNGAFPRLRGSEAVNPGLGCKFLIVSLAQPALLWTTELGHP